MKAEQALELKKAVLWENAGGGRVHCFLCAHHCRIAPSRYGFCGVRRNVDGTFYTDAYGTAVAANVDPIEKKPLFHFLPGTTSFSVATIGCNFQCGFCQNWQISQTKEAGSLGIRGQRMTPEEIVRRAAENGCESVSYTYTEPTIFFEYALETARLAKERGIRNVFVTNGYMTKEAIAMIRPVLDAANVDLKYFDDAHYRNVCKGSLAPVLETIRGMKEAGIWVEVTTLVIPGENDSDEELKGIAGFLAGTGKDIPWHVSAFHPDYKFTDVEATPPAALRRACAIGREAGLRYVYPGNIAEEENTYCYHCGELLVERFGFRVLTDRLKDSRCPRCRFHIDGVWKGGSEEKKRNSRQKNTP